AGIVHHDIAGLKIGRKLLDDRIEVAVPTVPLHFVVCEAETLYRLMSPILVRYPVEAARPHERSVPIRGRDQRPCDVGVQLEQVRDDSFRLPAPSADGRGSESVNERPGHPDSLARSLDAVRWIDHSEVKFGLRTQHQARER